MYYKLSFTIENPAPRTERTVDASYEYNWIIGQRFPKGYRPKTTVIVLDPEYIPDEDEPEKKEAIHSFYETNPPIFHDDLIACMCELGVDNLDCYPAEFHDPDNGVHHVEYKAVNVIGLMSAVDWKKSIAQVHPGGPMIDVTFDKLAIDEEKARRALVFRLRENPAAIWVHQTLKEHLEKTKAFPSLKFYRPDQVGFL